jgi:prevent-host-death family protein
LLFLQTLQLICKVGKVLANLEVWPYKPADPYTPDMKKPESLPVEEARKKFADVLDGTQFRSQHVEITRRGKPAGYVVPPEWYATAIEQAEEVKTLRREVASLRDAASDPGAAE